MLREYMKLDELVGFLNRLPDGSYNLYYWEGPGTTDYRVLTAESKQQVALYAAVNNSYRGKWAVEEQAAPVVN